MYVLGWPWCDLFEFLKIYFSMIHVFHSIASYRGQQQFLFYWVFGGSLDGYKVPLSCLSPSLLSLHSEFYPIFFFQLSSKRKWRGHENTSVKESSIDKWNKQKRKCVNSKNCYIYEPTPNRINFWESGPWKFKHKVKWA